MSAVTAKLANTVQPAPTTRPRVVTSHDGQWRYKIENKSLQIMYLDNGAWVPSSSTGHVHLERGHRLTLAGGGLMDAAILAGLLNRPTETVPAPTPEPTVVLEMPKDVAVSLMSLLGKVGGDGATTYRGDTEAIERALYTVDVYPIYSRFKLNGYAYGSTISGSLEGAAR